MDRTATWVMVQDAASALSEHYVPAIQHVLDEMNVPDGFGWLFAAWTFAPEPISSARMRVRSPYSPASLFDERLANAARHGFLTPVAGAAGDYVLSALGMQATRRVVGAAYDAMNALRPMLPTDAERLAGMLQRLVQACLTAPEPPGKWCVVHSQRTDPGDGASAMARIDQYLGDLGDYRDDAHLAAWQPLGVDGCAWDALSLVWRSEATTLDAIHHRLARRGYSRGDYAQALDDLQQRGWAEVDAGEFRATPQGHAIRQAAEDATDRYFYAPWSCLNDDEMGEMLALLTRLRDALNAA